ncbi:expressed unknown protein [Ectocarpus siliculosus]|uniref:Uncharacterized protein n=1 Tax=Ectocarpus siliculosus TaxID=2880 RepID=D8LKN2_ECTSI|nr:expressed unknown protein [Ectocarpus siliculosus]|eukprot:CBN74622.1 expressed unknown protein [Ectocarpus siliculosus]
MASALYICSRPVISPLLRELLSGGRHVASASASLVDSPAHSLAFCGVVLALYALAVVSRHFPDSRVARRSGAALLVTSMALLVLQPSALSGVVEGEHGGVGRSWKSRREYVEQACGVAVAGVGVLTLTGLTSPTKTLARKAAFAVAVGVPVGIWSALASMPGAAAAIVSWSALGAAGTYSCALMVLLEAALPRPAAVLSRRGSGSRAGGGGPAVGRARRVGSVVVELYVAVVAFMPAAGIAQGLQLLILGPVGRNLMGLAPPTGHNDGGGGGGGEGTNAQGAASFALATAATGHAVITVALKLLEERTGGAGGSGGGGGGDGRGAGAGFGRRRGVQGPASVSRAFGETFHHITTEFSPHDGRIVTKT